MPRKLSLKAYADNSITTAAIADDAVTAAKIPSGAVVADIADGSITTAKIADDAVTTAKIGAAAVTGTEIHTDAVTAAHLPDGYGTDLIGVIISYPKDTLPTGFLACDGSAVSRTTYAALFAVVGTTYGTGDGSSTFNVPDLRATFLRGAGDQTYSSKAYSGGTAGTKKYSHCKTINQDRELHGILTTDGTISIQVFLIHMETGVDLEEVHS